MNENEKILEVKHLKQYFGKKDFKAVDDVSFDIHKGEVFGVVGESGCGKTTTGRSIIKLYRATSGDVFFKGQRIVAGTRAYSDKIAELKKDKSLSSGERAEAIAEQKKLIKAANYDDKNCNKLYLERREKELKDEFAQKTKNMQHGSTEYKEAADELEKELKELKANPLMTKIQMIFQDPIASLNPRMTVREIIAEGMHIQGIRDEKYIDERVYSMLETVGLVKEHADRYPHEFSGGQRQRIGIARAVVMNPDLIIADEPISALDVSIQAQVINLLNDLRHDMGLTIMFIAHDLSVVKYFSDRIAVMYFGKIVELAESDELFAHPCHPYTKSLLSAIPLPDPHYEKKRRRIVYTPALDHDYSKEGPSLREVAPGHFVSCNTAELEKYQSDIARS